MRDYSFTQTPKYREKMRNAMLGKTPPTTKGLKIHTNEFKEKVRQLGKSNKGIKRSVETKNKLIEARKGRKPNLGHHWKLSDATKKKISKSHTGKKRSLTHIENMSIARKGKYLGKDGTNWKGGITPEHQKIRQSPEYVSWRTKVFIRDNFTCKECGNGQGGNLEAHHKKQFSIHPKLRFVVNNGITLCKKCHREVHKIKIK